MPTNRQLVLEKNYAADCDRAAADLGAAGFNAEIDLREVTDDGKAVIEFDVRLRITGEEPRWDLMEALEMMLEALKPKQAAGRKVRVA